MMIILGYIIINYEFSLLSQILLINFITLFIANILISLISFLE